jgi:hypothetical protein
MSESEYYDLTRGRAEAEDNSQGNSCNDPGPCNN